jgi:bifunctional DNase/RNase
MVECELSRIVIRDNSDAHYIYLKEKGGKRAFPIEIGFYEAAEINRKAMGTKTPRPLTHDLLRNAVADLGGKIRGIEVNELRESTFFATLVLEQNDKVHRVDCRPSDAIALAVAESVPIHVAESVLNDASGSPDEL